MKKRVAIIGASGGIGGACMTAFSNAGWEVVGADIRTGKSIIELDVTQSDAVDQFAQDIDADALIYAAGIVATMPITKTDFAVMRNVLAVNLEGAFYTAAAFARTMIRKQQGGSMVFLSSAAGIRGEANAAAYCASKAGLIGLVESIAVELMPYRLRVNAVAPGNVDTTMLYEVARGIARVENQSEEDILSQMSHAGAANRLVQPSEVASVCLALCDDGFTAVTGATLPVDIGYLLS